MNELTILAYALILVFDSIVLYWIIRAIVRYLKIYLQGGDQRCPQR